MVVDTIAAVATPPGQGGIGVVRLSGPGVIRIAEVLLGSVPPPRQAILKTFRDRERQPIDQGIALYFPAPASFTGEDVLELQGHGGPVVMDMLLARVLELGARPARAGEFSERAFLNDKMDLAQAEAVADLIAADSREAAGAAMASLQGAFSTRVHALTDTLIELRLHVESAIDFPEEEIDFLGDGAIARQLTALTSALQALRDAAQQGSLLQEGMQVVIAGRPNVGKSSLLNRLANRDSAIVTAIPGTTRDLLREQISIDGLPLHIIDTAGLRVSDDPVEQEGIRRAWEEIRRADRILMVVDDSQGISAEDRALREQLPDDRPLSWVYNKIDLTGRAASLSDHAPEAEVALSAWEDRGVELLRQHLKACMGYRSSAEGRFSARRRHLEALRHVASNLDTAHRHLADGSGELLAEELRLAQGHLGEITGEFSSDDLLGRIFTSFCIGK